MASDSTNSVMRDLKSASYVPADALADDLELPARSLKHGTTVLKLTLAKIKAYLAAAKVLVPSGGTTNQVLKKVDNTDFNFGWADPATGGATTLDGLTDVDTSTVAPTDGEVLKFEGSSGLWKPKVDTSGATNLDGLTDVDTSTVAPADGQVLKFEGSSGLWKPKADSVGTPGATNLDGLTDVDTSTVAPTNGQVLKFNSTSGLWVPANDAVGTSGATNLDGLTDVDTSTVAPTNGQVLKFNSTSGLWVPASDSAATNLDALTDVDTSTVAPTDGQVLKYQASSGQWKPAADATGGSGSGSMVLISTQTVSAVGSVVFDNTKINSSYQTYVLRWFNVVPTTNATAIGVQLSPDNGTTWRTATYNVAREVWGATTNFSNYSELTTATSMLIDDSMANDATIPSNGETTIYGLLSASVKKLYNGTVISKRSDGFVYSGKYGGIYTTVEAINAIRILASTGTISGTFALYGIA